MSAQAREPRTGQEVARDLGKDLQIGRAHV